MSPVLEIREQAGAPTAVQAWRILGFSPPAAEPGLWEMVHRGREKGASTPLADTWGKGPPFSFTSSTAQKLAFTHHRGSKNSLNGYSRQEKRKDTTRVPRHHGGCEPSAAELGFVSRLQGSLAE